MLLNESLWFRQKIEQYVQDGDILLNLGSSTKEFQERFQPHVYKNLFLPLETRGICVYHVDIKQEDEGVDLVGDLTDPMFHEQLKRLEPNKIICSNLLEHLEDRTGFCEAAVELLPVGGYIFASCPRDYPYHPDPIDTMFRPTVTELVGEFPKTRLIEGKVVACGTWRERTRYNCRLNYPRCYFRKAKQIVKMFMPFYKPKEWLEKITGKTRIDPDQELNVTCIVLRKR